MPPATGTSTAIKTKNWSKVLGLTSATMLVMGSMIGSGIFIVSAEIAREVNSPALLIGAWLVTGFLTIVGALSYGELAAMMPRAGGQYVYLREALGPLWGFLYGWTLFLVIQTGTIAAVGVAFGKFLGIFFPSISSTNWILHFWKVPPIHIGPMVLGNMDVGLNTQNLVAILVVVLLSVINIFGLKTGALIQNVFTVGQSFGPAGTGPARLFVGRNAQALAANFSGNFWHNASLGAQQRSGIGGPIVLVGTLTILAVAQVGSLFSADAWNNVTFTAGEVKNPSRNLPLSLALGTGVVIALYIACNFIYPERSAAGWQCSGRDDSGARHQVCHRRPRRHGRHDADVRRGRRIADGHRHHDFQLRLQQRPDSWPARASITPWRRTACSSAASRNCIPRTRRPAVSLMVQMVWTCVLCVSGSYGQLLDYIIFAVLVFYILTIFGLFVLRRTHPDAERPYRAIGYPVLPAIYIVMALFIDVVLLRYKPQYTWPGLIIVLLGIPVYFLWSNRSGRAAEVTRV